MIKNPKSIIEQFIFRAKNYLDRPAIFIENKIVTFREVINQINNNQQSNNQKTEVMAGNMDITIDPYTDRQLTSFGSVYP